MPLQFIRDDIFTIRVDAIVNAVTAKPILESSIGSAIFDATEAPQLKEAYNQIRRCKIGQAVITDGYELLSR